MVELENTVMSKRLPLNWNSSNSLGVVWCRCQLVLMSTPRVPSQYTKVLTAQ